MNGIRKNRSCRGQVIFEYAITMVMFMLAAFVLVLLMSALTEYGWRLISLIAWEPFS